MSNRNRYLRPIVKVGLTDNVEFNLRDKIVEAANLLTDKAQSELKKKLNPTSGINPTNPALLPYNAAIKNATQVSQGVTPVSFLSNPLFVGLLVAFVAIVGYMVYKNR